MGPSRVSNRLSPIHSDILHPSFSQFFLSSGHTPSDSHPSLASSLAVSFPRCAASYHLHTVPRISHPFHPYSILFRDSNNRRAMNGQSMVQPGPEACLPLSTLVGCQAHFPSTPRHKIRYPFILSYLLEYSARMSGWLPALSITMA